jgi:hypothetical protein
MVLKIERESIRSHSCGKLALEEAADLPQDVQQNDDNYCSLGDQVEDMFILSIIYMITSLITFNVNEYKLRIYLYGRKIHLQTYPIKLNARDINKSLVTQLSISETKNALS